MAEKESFLAIKSLFCKLGECIISDNIITINTTVEVQKETMFNPAENDEQSMRHTSSIPASVSFYISSGPRGIEPGISVKCQCLGREAVARVKDDASGVYHSSDQEGDGLVMEIMMVIQASLERELQHVKELDNQGLLHNQDKCKSLHVPSTGNMTAVDSICTCVVRIDHMRSKKKYCKVLEKWAEELGICARLLFCPKFNILLILQGSPEDIKKFNIRLKTTSVDVDSRGRSCKERMSSVLCEVVSKSQDYYRFRGFQEQELSSEEQIEIFFKDAHLSEIYRKFLRT